MELGGREWSWLGLNETGWMWVKMGERWRWVGVGRNGWGLVEECESGWRWVGVRAELVESEWSWARVG